MESASSIQGDESTRQNIVVESYKQFSSKTYAPRL